MQKYEEILKNKFGLESFREGQLDIIESVINKNDTLVFMPTGGGKSLIYQFSGVILDGLVLIISPLISLMKDQVDKLNELGLRAEVVNSTNSSLEKKNILDEITLNSSDEKGGIKFLYIAPERLNDEYFLNAIKSVNIALIAIDEAHCISQWGHDFRPSYLKIKDFIDDLRKIGPHPSLTFNGPHPSPLLKGEGMEGMRQNYFELPDYILEISKNLRKNGTQAEEILWEILRNRKFNNLKFRRQHPFGRYIADFYCDELKLVIEIDGKIHELQQEYDNLRDEIIKNYGVKILRFNNENVFNDLSKIFESILHHSPSPLRRGLGGGFKAEELVGEIFPIIALTATATKKVRTDIISRLGLKEYKAFTKGFDRKNLAFIVREISKETDKLDKVLEVVKKTPPYGIVYCSSVKAVSKVYQFLLENGVRVGIYNGEMKKELREQEQNNFMNSIYDVIVATNAFGMGIDKKDIRYVIHYNLPGSIENYYQEVGRAGRDGKNSYGVIIASYQDVRIQEFFIENTYPPKQDIIDLYNYLYNGIKIGQGVGTQILKTYNTIAIEANLKSDMKVGNIIKIFEKYGIVKRGFDAKEGEIDFRGRGITILLPKMKYEEIPILWDHQNLLKDEGYFKLEQVKKLLFKPGCRKRFVLEYFGDEEDLKNLPENCGVCDYCIDKKKHISEGSKEIISKNTFLIILEFIKRLDDKFGVQILAGVLVGSKENKILEWNLNLDKDFGILSIYKKDLVVAIFDGLIETGFLSKTPGQYPKIGITKDGLATIYNNTILDFENERLQSILYAKSKNLSSGKNESPKRDGTLKIQRIKIEKIDTYAQTLKLLEEKLTIDEIAIKREMTKQTIEEHITKLYSFNKITLSEILRLTSIEKLKKVKKIIEENFEIIDKLKPIKDLCSEDISYFDIKIAITMIEKGDL